MNKKRILKKNFKFLKKHSFKFRHRHYGKFLNLYIFYNYFNPGAKIIITENKAENNINLKIRNSNHQVLVDENIEYPYQQNKQAFQNAITACLHLIERNLNLILNGSE